jgi:N-acetylglucosaminyltransferase
MTGNDSDGWPTSDPTVVVYLTARLSSGRQLARRSAYLHSPRSLHHDLLHRDYRVAGAVWILSTGDRLGATLSTLIYVLASAYVITVVCHSILQTRFCSPHRGVGEIEAPSQPPSVDVVIPCYNEDPELLEACFHSVAEQEYGGELQVYVIDDGSPNRAALLPAYRAYQARPNWHVSLLDRNVGKRRAQDVAVRLGTGQLLVTMDSDTRIEPDAIQRLSAVFEDPKVGAAVGRIGVSNASRNWLTSLIGTRYRIAFEHERAAQSCFGAVLCCSGPFSMYRRAVVAEIWPAHREQRFLRVPCTFGDDLHLTLMVLHSGYRSHYVPTARAVTSVPVTIRSYLRQQLRWNKSFYRELRWTLPLLRRQPPYLALDVGVRATLPLLLPLLSVLALAAALPHDPATFRWYFGIVTFIALVIAGVWQTRDLRFFVLYGLFHVAFLIPTRLQAICTITDNRWGTRRASSAIARP